MIQDRFFDTNGQLRFPDGSHVTAAGDDGTRLDSAFSLTVAK